MLRAEHDGFMIAVINSPSISQRVREQHFHDGDDWHANDAETSLMMALNPAMVREDRLADSDDPDRTGDCVFSHPVNRTSLNGVTGSPSLASREKGEQLFSWMVEEVPPLRPAPIKIDSYFGHCILVLKRVGRNRRTSHSQSMHLR